jgi:GTP-binding protein
MDILRRSGKSSLINALVNQEKLVKKSKHPVSLSAFALATVHPETGFCLALQGHTKKLNFFLLDSQLALVDMPGYGHGSRDEWSSFILKYLEDRRQLRKIYLLMDARRGVKESDEQIIDILEGFNGKY